MRAGSRSSPIRRASSTTRTRWNSCSACSRRRSVLRFVIHMATRTVRLDDEAEETLRQIRKATGLPISEAFKRGLRLLQKEINQPKPTVWEAYQALGPIPGGSAIGPARDHKRVYRESLRKKYGR